MLNNQHGKGKANFFEKHTAENLPDICIHEFKIRSVSLEFSVAQFSYCSEVRRKYVESLV